MHVELEPLATEPEAYRVTLAEDEAAATADKKIVGTITRIAASDQWNLTITEADGEPVENEHGLSILIQAANAEELRTVLALRLGTAEIPSDRLKASTFEPFATSVMLSLLTLARTTGSVPGMAEALARVMAQLQVSDIKPEGLESFRATFGQHVITYMEGARQMVEVRASMARALKDLVRGINDDDSEEQDAPEGSADASKNPPGAKH